MLCQYINRRADNVFVRFYFAIFKAIITVHSVQMCHWATRFIKQISKEVPYETLSISFRFHKIVHENTLP